MKVLHSWIQDYIEETLPSANDIAEELTMHAFEIEGVETLPDGDAIIDVDVLPNRAHDSLCHYGLAREIATLFNLTFRIPDISYETDTALKSSDVLSLSIEKSALVPRATKRLLSDIVVGPSPELIKTRLEKLGQRSINNVVDITNYVMLETGQPVHAFDFAKVSKGKEKKEFTIRGAREGEKVATLDGKEFTLSEGMLVIADEDRALDIAGIKGGVDSGIDEHTKQLILSACNFNSTAIRKTSRKLGLLTDASKRFEQGITPEIITRAVERASELFQKYASARVASDIVDVYPRRRNPYMLGVSVSEVNAVLGLSLSEDDVASVLKRLAFSNVKVAPRDTIIALAKNLEGAEYMYGASVVCDAPQRFDCSSLINYLYSRVGLPVPRMTVDQYVFGDAIEKEDLKPGDIVFSRNRNGDIAQTKTFTRVADGQEVTQETLHAVSKEFMPGVEVQGGVDHNGMYLGDGKILHAARKNGVVALEPLEGNDAFMDIVGYRRFLQTEEDRFVVTVPNERLDLRIIEDLIEEIGRVYGYDKIPSGKLSSDVAPIFNKKFYYVNKVRDLLVENGYSEVYMYSFASKGDIEVQNPPAENRKFLRKTLSDGLENSVEQGMYYKDFLGLSAVRIFEIGTVFEGDSEHLALAVRLSGVKDKVRDTELAMVAEKLSALLGVEIGVQNGAIEVNLTDSIQKLPDPTSHDDLASIDTQGKMFAPLSQYPFVLRDIAVWTPENVVSSEIQKLIEEVAGPLLVRMALFDEFKKEGKVSYAFHLVFQSMEKTLADTDVEVPMKRVTDAFAEKGWTVR